MKKDSRPVYSTETGRLCPGCGQPAKQCRCKQAQVTAESTQGGITVWRERKGRGGKEVTVIRNLPLNTLELQLLASTLKKHCGSGGTATGNTIEIQGDHRDKIKAFLEQEGYQAKLAGG